MKRALGLVTAFAGYLSNTRFLISAGDIKQEAGGYREGPPYQRRGSLQLWQFLVALLDDPTNSHFIAWTGRGMEFKLIEPEEVKPSNHLASLQAQGKQPLLLRLEVPTWLFLCPGKAPAYQWYSLGPAASQVLTANELCSGKENDSHDTGFFSLSSTLLVEKLLDSIIVLWYHSSQENLLDNVLLPLGWVHGHSCTWLLYSTGSQAVGYPKEPSSHEL